MARLLTGEELEAWMQDVPWIFASTMKAHPHEYTLRRQQDPRRFQSVVRTIWEKGYDRKYLGRLWRSLDVGDQMYCWVCTAPEPDAPAPLRETILINRARRSQERLF